MGKSCKSRYAILGMLAVAPKSSGYDIKKNMEGSTQYFWKESYGSIYPVLARLIKEGLIMQHEGSTHNGRERHVYELTKEGTKELILWLNKPVAYEQPRNELLLKLFFGEFTPLTTTRKHIEEFRQILLEKEKIFQTIRGNLLSTANEEAGLPYWLISLDYGVRQVKSALEWCESALKQHDLMEKIRDKRVL